MKKDLHDLIYTIWIDGKTAMMISDEPHGTHHIELFRNEHAGRDRFGGETTDKTGIPGKTEDRQLHDQNRKNGQLQAWVKEVAHKVRYARTIHILGSGDVRHLLQNEIESDKTLRDVIITNAACKKLSQAEFEEIARENLVH